MQGAARRAGTVAEPKPVASEARQDGPDRRVAILRRGAPPGGRGGRGINHLGGFEGRGSLRAWLYRICTNTCLRAIERRPKRVLTLDHGPASTRTDDLGEPVLGPVWLEPWFDQEPLADAAESDPELRLLETSAVPGSETTSPGTPSSRNAVTGNAHPGWSPC
jgi:hypothetical protein